MKKIIGLIFVLSFVFIGLSASASTCGHPALNHPAYEVYPPEVTATTTIPAIDNNDCSTSNPMLVMQPWGLPGWKTPTIQPGQSVTDEAGNTYTCGIKDFHGCSDLTHTDYYRNLMRETGRQLISNGFAVQFPQFAFWSK